MDWSKGLSAQYRAFIVDPVTWSNKEEIEIVGGTISKSEDSLRESADITVPDYPMDKEQWIRIYFDARQSSDSYYGPIFTGLISSPTKDIEGLVKRNNLRCYSVLKPANDMLLPKGYYIQYGSDSESVLESLLSVMRGTPIIFPENETVPDLQQTIIAEGNETHLSMADKILDSIGWKMRIDGDGSIIIMKPSSEPTAAFDALELDSLETKVNLETNWFDCPNVFRAVSENSSETVMDEDPDSPFSIQNRGREIWMEESGCTPYIGESLYQYAARRLGEEQQIFLSASYSRRFDPNANIFDVISLKYPAQELDGLYYISSQNITLGYSPTVSEVVYKI